MFRIRSRCQNQIRRNYVTLLRLFSSTVLRHVIAWRDRMWPVFAGTVLFTVESVMGTVPVFAAKSVMGKKGQNIERQNTIRRNNVIELRHYCMARSNASGFDVFKGDRADVLGNGEFKHSRPWPQHDGSNSFETPAVVENPRENRRDFEELDSRIDDL